MNALLTSYRLRILLAGFAAALCVMMNGGCHQSVSSPPPEKTKEAFLRGLAEEVIAPAYAELDAKCQALHRAATELRDTPTAGALQKARESWIDVALSAQKMECFRIGPIVDRGITPAFFFWPSRPASIERVIKRDAPLSDSQLEELGAAVKGVNAIEYLLFPPPTTSAPGDPQPADTTLEQLSGASGERRRQYLAMLAGELAAHSEMLAREWRELVSPSTLRFVEGDQASVNALVNKIGWCLEHVTQGQLRAIESGSDQKWGTRSGTTNRRILASIQGLQRIYAGTEKAGLDNYLRHLGLPVAERMDRLFADAVAAVAQLDGPADAIAGDEAEKARVALGNCHALELLIKVDVTSVLGVTLTYSSVDGD